MTGTTKRIIGYCIAGIIAMLIYQWMTWWQPSHSLNSTHFRIDATASVPVVTDAAERLEKLYHFYTTFFALPARTDHDALHVRIYATREEMHAVNPIVSDWAEGFYMGTTSHQYINTYAGNPYDSLIHEGIHQLNKQVAGFSLAQWIEEGLACFFTVHYQNDGHIDPSSIHTINIHSYPIRHIGVLPLSGDRAQDKRKGHLIAIKDLVEGTKPLPMDTRFNTYYLHWYSLTSYLMLDNKQQYQKQLIQYIRDGSPVDKFESYFTNYESLEQAWYQHLCEIQKSIKANK